MGGEGYRSQPGYHKGKNHPGNGKHQFLHPRREAEPEDPAHQLPIPEKEIPRLQAEQGIAPEQNSKGQQAAQDLGRGRGCGRPGHTQGREAPLAKNENIVANNIYPIGNEGN